MHLERSTRLAMMIIADEGGVPYGEGGGEWGLEEL